MNPVKQKIIDTILSDTVYELQSNGFESQVVIHTEEESFGKISSNYPFSKNKKPRKIKKNKFDYADLVHKSGIRITLSDDKMKYVDMLEALSWAHNYIRAEMENISYGDIKK